MKKNTVLVLLSFLFSLQAYSQGAPAPAFGVKGGLNFTNIGGQETDNALTTDIHLGAYGQAFLNYFWELQMELVLSGQGHGAKTDLDNKLNLLFINMPVMLAFDPSYNINLHAGTQIGLLVSAKSKFQGESFDVKDQFKTIDVGLTAGISYYLMDKQVSLTARYIHGLSSLSQNSQSRFNRVIQVGAGFMLSRVYDD